MHWLIGMRADQAARAGFAIGWARVTALQPIGVTAHASAACLLVMAAAGEAPEHVVEASLRVGHLEGTWAVIYDRRNLLADAWGATLRTALIALGKSIDWRPALTGRRESAGSGLDPVQVAAAQTAAADALRQQQQGEAWKTIEQILHDTTRAATAEGRANALAQIADLVNVDISFDLAYQAGFDALDGMQSLWDDATRWMTRIVGDMTNELGRTIAAGWRDGLSITAQEQAIMDLLGADRNSASFVLDQLVGHALAEGSVTTYSQAGLNTVDFLTAGDDRVDAECDQAESGNPWPLDEAPRPPLHNMCRCTLAPPTDATLTTDVTQLLDPYLAEGA